MIDCFRFRRLDREDFIAFGRGKAMLSRRVLSVNLFLNRIDRLDCLDGGLVRRDQPGKSGF